MSDRTSVFSWDRFHRLPVVGILRGFEAGAIRELLGACRRGGLENIEITMNSPGAESLIRIAVEEAGDDLNVGAGTVLDEGTLERALEGGASFIVTPVVVPEVIRACRERQVPVFPGALTPTEVHAAWKLGADLVKVFPASVLGPAYIRELKAPLGDIKLMPTGGVTAASLPEYRRAGADGFGVGSPLFRRERVAAGDWPWVEEQARRFVEAFHSVDSGE